MNPFDNARVLVARAVEHTNELERRFGKYLESGPTELITRIDLNTGRYIYGVKIAPVPFELSAVLFDAVNALRSALDHAVVASASLFAVEGWPEKQSKFPIGVNEAALVKEANKPACHPDAEIREFLIQIGARQGGSNESLWALNTLRNIKNHRRLVQLHAPFDQIEISHAVLVDIEPHRTRNTDTGEITVFSCSNITKPNIKVSLYLELAEAETLSGQDAVQTLAALCDTVHNVIAAIEEESVRRISHPPPAAIR